jgi:hypothetical protein
MASAELSFGMAVAETRMFMFDGAQYSLALSAVVASKTTTGPNIACAEKQSWRVTSNEWVMLTRMALVMLEPVDGMAPLPQARKSASLDQLGWPPFEPRQQAPASHYALTSWRSYIHHPPLRPYIHHPL